MNRALKLARLDEDAEWWKWDVGRRWLMSRECVVAGKHPQYRQMWDYVARIRRFREHPPQGDAA